MKTHDGCAKEDCFFEGVKKIRPLIYTQEA